jgi:ubiquinone/menaquinone biosynthesis C-methylase UbiE
LPRVRDQLVDLLFRVWSPIYDSPLFQKPFYRRVHARVMAALDGVEPRRAIDLGCGTAQLTADLAARFPGATLAGVDLSIDMLGAARRRLGAAAPPLVNANVYALPFADGSLDLVTNTASFHWYLDYERALAEIHRVLRPGGRFVLATLTDTLFWKLMRQVRITTAGQLRSELEAAGFRVERSERVRPWVTLYVAIRD